MITLTVHLQPSSGIPLSPEAVRRLVEIVAPGRIETAHVLSRCRSVVFAISGKVPLRSVYDLASCVHGDILFSDHVAGVSRFVGPTAIATNRLISGATKAKITIRDDGADSCGGTPD